MNNINQKGISLVQVLLAAAMLAGLALVIAKLGLISSKVKRSASTSTEVYQHINMLEKLMLNTVSCRRTLAPANLTGGPLAPGQNRGVNKIIDFSNPPIDLFVPHPTEAFTPSLILESLEVRRGGGTNPWPPNELRLLANFKRFNEDAQRRSFGAMTFTKTITINARFSGNTVVQCYSDLDNVVDNALEAVCLNFHNGASYNPVTGVCTPSALTSNVTTAIFSTPAHNSTINRSPWDYCALARAGGEDGYKDSTNRSCTVSQLTDTNWRLRSFLHEGRSNYCSMVCFRFL